MIPSLHISRGLHDLTLQKVVILIYIGQFQVTTNLSLHTTTYRLSQERNNEMENNESGD